MACSGWDAHGLVPPAADRMLPAFNTRVPTCQAGNPTPGPSLPTRSRKQALAGRICSALAIHCTIEEEIFYPAFIEATEDKDLHHEAIVEHNAAKTLIAEIEASSPEDDFFDAKVKVLSEMSKHHVKDEEQPGGMFAEARKSNMDLVTLGKEMKLRKKDLEGQRR